MYVLYCTVVIQKDVFKILLLYVASKSKNEWMKSVCVCAIADVGREKYKTFERVKRTELL